MITKQKKEIKITKTTSGHHKIVVIPLVLEQFQECHVFLNLRTATRQARFDKFKKNEKVKSNATVVRTYVLLKFATGAWFYSILSLKEKHKISRLKLVHIAVGK